MYKMLTFIITERIYSFLDTNNILPAKQGCRKGSFIDQQDVAGKQSSFQR